jgi:hypothetical protein
LCWHIIDDLNPRFDNGHRLGIDGTSATPTYDVYSSDYLRVIYQHSGRN